MSGSKLGVLGLSLLSALILFYGALLAAYPFLDPQIIVRPDPLVSKVEPGCFGVPVLLFIIFIALFPALGAFRLWRSRVCTQAAKELQENEYDFQLEEKLQQALAQAVDLLLTKSPEVLPEAFVSDVRGYMSSWNRSHRARLFRFLTDLGFNGDWVTAGDDDELRLSPAISDSLWKRSQPLATAAVVAWLSLSLSFLVIAVLVCLGLSYRAPARPGQIIIGLMGCSFIPSLLSGLAAVGIGWLFFRERNASRRRQRARDGVQELILRHSAGMIQSLRREIMTPREFSNARSVVRALAIAGTTELDGIRKGRLLSLLQQSGWLEPDIGIDLCGASFRAANLTGTILSRAYLRRTDMSQADLSRADLQQADLRECNLREADLRFANLGGADLRGADLRGARCQQARMESAKLDGVLLDGAKFWGADLRDTVLDDSWSDPALRFRTRG
jgi:hypothetical protein